MAFTNINDLKNKKNNAEQQSYVQENNIPKEETLSAEDFVNKIVAPIQELQQRASKTVTKIVRGATEFLPDEDGVVTFPAEATTVSVLCKDNLQDIVSIDGTCKVNLAFTSSEGGSSTFEIVDVQIQIFENGEYNTVGKFSATSSDYTNPIYTEYDLSKYGLTNGVYNNLLLVATGKTTQVSGRYQFNSVTLTELKIQLARDFHQPIFTSQQTTFPLDYTIYGAVAKKIFITVKGATGNLELQYDLTAKDDNTTVHYSQTENSAYKILSHGVHEVTAYLRCDDGRGGYLYSNVLINNFMIVNGDEEYISEQDKPKIMIQKDTTYDLLKLNTYALATNFVQSTLCNYAVYSPHKDSDGNYSNTGDAINVSFLLTSPDDGAGHWDEEYFRINTMVEPGVSYKLETTVEIEAEEGAIVTNFYNAYLHIIRTDSNNIDYDFLNESNKVTNKYIKVDNTEAFSPLSGATFLLNPKVRNNSELHPDKIINARAVGSDKTVDSQWENFGFVNDGWISSDQDKQKVLRVPAGATLRIKYNPFKQFIISADSSMTLDIDFAVRNITNEVDPVLRIFEYVTGTTQKKGLDIRPINGALFTASNVNESECNFFWQEDTRTHLSINIHNSIQPGGIDALHPDSSTTLDLAATKIALCRVFINGVIVREMKFNTNLKDEFCTKDAFIDDDGIIQNGIVIGNNSGADIDIYSIRCYENKQVSASEVLQNYIATLPTSEEKIAIRQANDILTSGRIDVAKVKERGKRVLIWHGIEPYYYDSGAQFGWWEIHQYNDDGTENKNISGTIAKETKKLKATRQGSTANTYYYSNLQTKIKDLEKREFIKVPIADLHESIHYTDPYPETTKDDSGQTIDTGKMLIKIWGGNLGKQYPVYEDEAHSVAYEYIEEDGVSKVIVPDGWVDGNGKYRGLGYLVQEDLPLGQKLVLKINYASCMQSHLQGCTRAYNDLYRKVVGANGIQENKKDPALSVDNARVAKYNEPFFFFTQTEGSNAIYYRGPGTFGPGKMDKPTWGYDKKTHPMFCLIEGSDNNYEQTDFLVPWDTNEIYYDPDAEGWFHYGLQGWDFDAGATEKDADGAEYPLGSLSSVDPKKDYMTRIREIFNWVYLHSNAIGFYNGTFDRFKDSEQSKNLKIKYWCTQGDDAFKLKRYRYHKYTEEYINADGEVVDRNIDDSGWVDAGLPIGSNHVKNVNGSPLYWKDKFHSKCSTVLSNYPVMESIFAPIDVRTDDMFMGTYDKSPNQTQFSALNQEFINAIVAHAKKYIGWYIKPESLRFHYVFINHLMAGTDNCSKNTYYVLDPVAQKVTIDDETKECYLLELHQDDVDTIFGTDNNGRTTKPYYIDRMHQYADEDLSTSLYEGNANVLFNLCEAMYESTKELQGTLKSTFTAMTELVKDSDVIPGLDNATAKVSVWGFFQKYFFATQRYFPIVAWNEAARIRYEYPKMLGYISSGSGARHVDPITQSLGDQLQSELQYMKRRLIYMTSYAAWGQFYDSGKNYNIGVPDIGDTFSMQAFHLPHETQSSIEYKFTVVPHQYMYPTGMMGQTSVDPHVRVAPGQPFVLNLGTTSSNDTGMSILGINFFRSIGNIGDLSTSPALKLTINGKRLTEFKAIPTKLYTDALTGESVPAFRPGSIEVSANRIENFSLYGCKQIGGTLDLKNLSRLKNLDIRSTNITGCTLPQTSALENVKFPGGFTTLTFENLLGIKTIDMMQGRANLNSIVVKNCSQYTYDYILSILDELL